MTTEDDKFRIPGPARRRMRPDTWLHIAAAVMAVLFVFPLAGFLLWQILLPPWWGWGSLIFGLAGVGAACGFAVWCVITAVKAWRDRYQPGGRPILSPGPAETSKVWDWIPPLLLILISFLNLISSYRHGSNVHPAALIMMIVGAIVWFVCLVRWHLKARTARQRREGISP